MARKRGQGEGSITKRPDGRWMAQISAGTQLDPVTGMQKRKRVTIYGKTRKEVQEKLTQLLSDQQQGINIAPDKITLGAWIDQWIELYSKPYTREGTWGMYQSYTKTHIKPSLGHIDLAKLTAADLQKFINQKQLSGRLDGKEGGLSSWTIRGLHQVINLALKQAVKEGFVRQNPASSVRLPDRTSKAINPMDENKVTKFLDTVKDHRLYAAFVLELVTGIRRGELLGLKWEDIDFQNGYLEIKRSVVRNKLAGGFRINEPKTRKSKRTIYVAPLALEELKKHSQKQEAEKQTLDENYIDEGFVFCKENGEIINPTRLYQEYQEQLIKAELPSISFHALRHTVATILLKRGVQLKTVQELLGHASIVTTGNTYSHVLEEVKKEAAIALNDLVPQSN